MRSIITVIIIVFSIHSFAAALVGKVTDETGQPLPFVAVYIEGTTEGTTTNSEGNYSLGLNPGTYKIIYNLFGYSVHSEMVQMSYTNKVLNIILSTDRIELSGVTVKAGAEDPAFAIIRKTIKRRKYHLEEVKEYACDAYIKGVIRISKHPDKILGRKLTLSNLDTVSGIAYLSESVSKLYYKRPDKIKEEMISSKVSGNNLGFSYNQESDFLFNFYENNIELEDVGERGFVSPVANNALSFYNYHLVQTFVQNGHIIDKIEVIPKRRHDPVFRGYICIEEPDWRIYSVDVSLNKDAEINFVDSLTISQLFLPVDSAIWLPFSNKIKFAFSVFGIKGDGVYIAANTHYTLHPVVSSEFFKGEIMKVDTDANKKDSAYWSAARPVPLTYLEARDYQKKDSLQKIHESKGYLDSIDRKTNKFGIGSVLFGYRYRQRYKKQTWVVSPIIQTIDFNTVQGLNVGTKVSFTKELKDFKLLAINTSAGYGFSNRRWYGNAGINYIYNPDMHSNITLSGGIMPVQFNPDNPISSFNNTLYTLFQVQNFMKLYQKEYIDAKNTNEITNGINVEEGVEYADRTPLNNTTDYKLVHIGSRDYTFNDPVNPSVELPQSFFQQYSLAFSAQLKIHFVQHYISRPHHKIILPSRYPALTIDYRKATGFTGSGADYDAVKCSASGKLGFKLFGESSYTVSAGKFITDKSVGFMDYTHFDGNRTIFLSSNPQSFQLLSYYKYSTTNPYAEVHLEHNFAGFIFNKIPWFCNLKLDEIAGINYLSSAGIPQYAEFYAGISKLQTLQIDFAIAFMKNARVADGIRIGLGL